MDGFLKILDFVDVLVEFDYGDVLFTGGLLGFNESGGIVDADNETAGDFGV